MDLGNVVSLYIADDVMMNIVGIVGVSYILLHFIYGCFFICIVKPFFWDKELKFVYQKWMQKDLDVGLINVKPSEYTVYTVHRNAV